eukprot:TRINITY_DN16364_c0_g1_i1.p1 TRINITY_DN16364_c0_g1~~TRINITY_DN16364_c0_g1_i1.p1  ORF type:complete len:521 (-),score=106.95 TRINITY_DN16364_c0_g1_i1:50-1612(-)
MRWVWVSLIVTLVLVLGCVADQEISLPNTVFYESFGDAEWNSRWTVIRNDKYQGRWEVGKGLRDGGFEGEEGLILKDAGKHSAIVSLFSKPFAPKDVPLIIQYEVKYDRNLECGGAYLKLVSEPVGGKPFDPNSFGSDTPYTIMFGPDKCGSGGNLHFIYRHKHPITGEVIERKSKYGIAIPYLAGLTHLYTVKIFPNNTYFLLYDQLMSAIGDLRDDVVPILNPPKEIPDPEQEKPLDWDDDEFLPDPTDVKPEDWDVPEFIPDLDAKMPVDWDEDAPEMIPDPEAVKPSAWDDELDGDWVPPEIVNPKCLKGCGKWVRPMRPNPEYKGEWSPRLIPNPNYKGEWIPRMIPNPEYFVDEHPHNFQPAMVAVGFELWTTTSDIRFDNILVTTDPNEAKRVAEELWRPKFNAEKVLQDAKLFNERLDKAIESQGLLKGYFNVYFEWLLKHIKKLSKDSPQTLVFGSIAICLPFFMVCWSKGGTSSKKRVHTTREQPTPTTQIVDSDDKNATVSKRKPNKET